MLLVAASSLGRADAFTVRPRPKLRSVGPPFAFARYHRLHVMAMLVAPDRSTALATRKGGAAADGAASTASLVKDALGDAVEVLQAHVELAVLEVREDVKVAARAGAMLAVGGALAFLALALLLAAAAFALALVMPAWGACLIVGTLVGIIAAIVLVRARNGLVSHGFGEQSTLALAESKQWIGEKSSEKKPS